MLSMNKYAYHTAIPPDARSELRAYPPLVQQLLFHRGIQTAEAAETFLRPDYEAHLHDPFLLKGMSRAVDRILTAIKNKEKIVIYSDYDMDGIPGGVVLHDFFKKIGYEQFDNYIPCRHEEGYGMNVPAMEQFAQSGVRLIVTIDCGIADREPVRRAKELGMDVIITDHHVPSGVLPDAYAIIDHNQEGETYPEAMLCGAGLAFKLVQALIQKGGFAISAGWEKWLLDMAGMATIADMVPLRGENRALAHFGLVVLRKSSRPGIQQLCRKMRTDQRYLTEDDVGFMIGPRVNAASRMGEAMDAFKLLATKDEVEAVALADHLNKVNDERKGVVASMSKEIKKRVGALGDPREVLVMGDPRWRPSLLGLAANSLVETYERPVFLWGRGGSGVIKGSCRSDGSVDLVALMSETKELFIEFGGHKCSGGFSIEQDRVHELEKRLLASYKTARTATHERVSSCIDAELAMEDVRWETYGMMARLAPFGIDNPKPLFMVKGAMLADVRQFGRDAAHLELKIARAEGHPVSAIGFFTAPDQFEKPLKAGARVDIVATMEKSMFRNKPELRLRIVDIV